MKSIFMNFAIFPFAVLLHMHDNADIMQHCLSKWWILCANCCVCSFLSSDSNSCLINRASNNARYQKTARAFLTFWQPNQKFSQPPYFNGENLLFLFQIMHSFSYAHIHRFQCISAFCTVKLHDVFVDFHFGMITWSKLIRCFGRQLCVSCCKNYTTWLSNYMAVIALQIYIKWQQILKHSSILKK